MSAPSTRTPSLAEPPVFAVADGMGGHAFGDRASATAVLALREEFDPAARRPSPDARVRRDPTGERGRARAHGLGGRRSADRRHHAGRRGARGRASGCRSALDGLQPRRLAGLPLGHRRGVPERVGSRLERISVDHSLVQELIDAGLIDEERRADASRSQRHHPGARCRRRRASAEAWLLPATRPQTFLICSDGLTKELDDDRIAELLVPVRARREPGRGGRPPARCGPRRRRRRQRLDRAGAGRVPPRAVFRRRRIGDGRADPRTGALFPRNWTTPARGCERDAKMRAGTRTLRRTR